MTVTKAAPCLAQNHSDYVVEILAQLGMPIRVAVDDDLALVQAHVPSGQAARMLKPLGRKAVGVFRALSGNMVVIDAIVSLSMAHKMLEASRVAA